jgi:hypothetical protein
VSLNRTLPGKLDIPSSQWEEDMDGTNYIRQPEVCGSAAIGRRQDYYLASRVPAAGPRKADDPADDRPSKQKIDEEDGTRAHMLAMMSDDRRQEVHRDGKQQCN